MTNFEQHLVRQMAFSHATYGPGVRTEGVLDHIKKEIEEVRESGGAVDEWVDLVMLSLDGLTRQLAYSNGDRNCPLAVADHAVTAFLHKQGLNEARAWPDWRTAEKGKAIEHDRSGE